MARKPRIVITIVTGESSIETSIIKGRPMRDGKLSPGPTERQFAIAHEAIRKLIQNEVE